MLPITIKADMALAIDEHTKELGPYYDEKRCLNCGYEQRRYSLPGRTTAQLLDEYRRGADSGRGQCRKALTGGLGGDIAGPPGIGGPP